MSLLPATVWVAEELDYLDEEGLNLTIREFDSGRNALETMLKDPSINMATVTLGADPGESAIQRCQVFTQMRCCDNQCGY